MPYPGVPQELIDQIIDLLGRTDADNGDYPSRKKALKACSLVSKSFRARSKKHLFSYLRLAYPEALKDPPTNLRLQQYPTIAPYIERLDLFVVKHATLDSLSHVTEMLSPLRSFTLIGAVNWEVVSIALDKRRQVSSPLLSSQLTTLCLRCVTNVPPTLFSTCVNLTFLLVSEVELQPSSSHTEGAVSEEADSLFRPRLLKFSLLFFSREKLVERLCPSKAPSLVDLSSLRSLTIKPASDYREEDMVAVRELMTIPKDTLHHLSWCYWNLEDPGCEPPLIPFAVDLSLFPALRTFEILLVVESSGAALYRVCSILATISNSPITLDMLTILIPIGIEVDDDPDEDDPTYDINSVSRIPLESTSYSDLEWRRLLNVLLRTSCSSSGISESPIARHILFDFRFPPGPLYYGELRPEEIENHRSNCEWFISRLVKREFSKLSQKSDVTKFEYRAKEESSWGRWC